MDRIGRAEHEVADQCIDENIKEELELTLAECDGKLMEWLES